MEIKILIILISCGCSQVSKKGEYLEPIELSKVEEKYIYGDSEYIMVNYRSTWSEAELICASYQNGTFATIPTPRIAFFLAEALSESNMEPEHLWIGARRDNDKVPFIWTNGKSVPERYMITRGQETMKLIRNCLAFSRLNHTVPLFVNLECHAKRPFLCEKPYKKVIEMGEMTTPDWIPVGSYQYGIFYDKISFAKAVGECSKKQYAHLASFRTAEEIKAVTKFMLIGRPSLERAWIGARYLSGGWSFINSGTALDVREDNKTGFPPWRYGRSTKRSGCLSLDRHVLIRGVFLETRCFKRQAYVCARARTHPNFITSIFGKVGYVLYYIEKTWDQALLHCQRHSADLAIVTIKNIHDVTSLMGENYTEIHHIWIGGRLGSDGEHFYWYSNREKLLNNRNGLNYFPPWYDVEFDRRFACLNMDRENHNFPMFYGADCSVPQPFLCSQTNLTALPVPGMEMPASDENDEYGLEAILNAIP